MARNRGHQTQVGHLTKKAEDRLKLKEIPKETLSKIKKAKERPNRLEFERKFAPKVEGEADKRTDHRSDRRQGKKEARRWREQY